METTFPTTSTIPPSDTDLTSILPAMEEVLQGLVPVLRFLVMAGPLALLGLGLYCYLLPPKEANFSTGYRFRYGMSRVWVWQFMQRLAGIVFGLLGLVLTVVMALLCLGLDTMAAMDGLMFCVKCLLWEIGLVLVAQLGVNITVMVRYDRNGDLRTKMNTET